MSLPLTHKAHENITCNSCDVGLQKKSNCNNCSAVKYQDDQHETKIVFTKNAPSLTSTNNYNKRQRRRQCCLCFFHSNATSRTIVFFIFSVFVLGAITAFFCWPRTPRISMGGGAVSLNGMPPDWWAGERFPIEAQDNTVLPSRPSLRGTWQINVTLDNRDNWIPTHIRSLEFVLIDSLTLAKFAWASSSPMVLQPKTISPLSLTFNVNYQAPDNTDPTFQNLYNSCGPLKSPGSQRPALNVLLKVYIRLYGIIWTPIVIATPYTGGILCPMK